MGCDAEPRPHNVLADAKLFGERNLEKLETIHLVADKTNLGFTRKAVLATGILRSLDSE